jgi:hypothetical protein
VKREGQFYAMWGTANEGGCGVESTFKDMGLGLAGRSACLASLASVRL